MIFRSVALDIGRNWTITHVNDGEKCIRYLETTQYPPDFILMDINMPRINGINCASHILSQGLCKGAYIYMLSTSTSDIDITEAYRAGAHLYIPKPNSYNELRNILQACIDKEFAKNWQRRISNFVVFSGDQLKH